MREVMQCRQRRRIMREAVRLRRQLAASHAAYLRSLSSVASALTGFAAGKPIPLSDHTPLVTITRRPFDVGAATRTQGVVGGGDEIRLVVRHRSLAEVAVGLEEYFVKASLAGNAVSCLLKDDDSSDGFLGALCCLSAPSVDRLDSMNGRPRHSATLQKLLDLERKLYKDVKARVRLQIKYNKATAALQAQEHRWKIGVGTRKLMGSGALRPSRSTHGSSWARGQGRTPSWMPRRGS